MSIPVLDPTDRALLALLRDDARAPTAELARKLTLSRTTVQSRMERLQRQLDRAAALGRERDQHMGAYQAGLELVGHRDREAGDHALALRRIPEVRVLHSVSGPFDLIAIVAAASIGELDALIDRIGGLDGVERTTSAIVLSTRIQR